MSVQPNEQSPNGAKRTFLVTGATGYIGGRLIPKLLERGVRVRIMARHPENLRQREWFADVEVVAGDATDSGDLATALHGVDVAYYLMHSLGTGVDFEQTETRMATAFARVAREEDVGRIVYLGGMVPRRKQKLSPHLRSRAQVGEILRASGVPTVELRAAVIIGSGSASFEMLRYLTERLPAMITPRWVRTKTQPIAVRDVLYYLVGAADLPKSVNRVFDIGGPDVLTYQGMMQEFAAESGLRKRIILPINLLSPGLSSHWVGLITPVPRGIARPLVESLKVEVVCGDHEIAEYIPDPDGGLLSYRKAVAYAVRQVRDASVTTRWSSAGLPKAPADPLPTDPNWAGGSLYTDTKEEIVPQPPAAVWPAVERIGGDTGYYAADWMWEIRGAMDRVIGGVGLRRGRRDPEQCHVGDSVDFWRVEERIKPELLRLRAEMRLPGLAWLEWQIEPEGTGSRVTQRAIFYPRGLAGQAYWWAVAPFHAFVFKPMLHRLVQQAAKQPVSPLNQHPGRSDAAAKSIDSDFTLAAG